MPPTPPRKIVLLDRTVTPPRPVDAEVVRDFPDSALSVVESLWAAERLNLPSAMGHTHWDWGRKAGTPIYEVIAVVAGGQVEGLAAVARSPAPSKLAPGVAVAYLAYLETAPWNLKLHPTGGRFRGVGEALLEEVVLLGYHRGNSGRVLLSSLPQAEDFYRRKGMTEISPIAPGGLIEFEYTEAQSLAFLATRGTTVR